MPVAAQAPGPTTGFDGIYAGVSREVARYTSGGSRCFGTAGVPAPLAITNGVARTQGGGGWDGNVTPQGRVVMRDPYASRYDGQIDSQGTIRGQFSSTECVYTLVWQKAPTSTTAFDGEYRGVSREVSDSGSTDHRCYPHALTPPRGLTITHGVVRTPGKAWWEGTVGPRGAAVMRNPKFPRVDAEIDPQGMIRGHYSGEIPDEVLAQIDGGGTNCIVKFVWQKEGR
jgi:hypothetical protein